MFKCSFTIVSEIQTIFCHHIYAANNTVHRAREHLILQQKMSSIRIRRQKINPVSISNFSAITPSLDDDFKPFWLV